LGEIEARVSGKLKSIKKIKLRGEKSKMRAAKLKLED
jgi:hypothetical protein